jgi:hypothetical protein
VLLGDKAYRGLPYIVGLYSKPAGGVLDPPEAAFNRQAASIRISVEQIFGRKAVLWRGLTWRHNLMMGNQAVGAYHMVAILLTNCLTCFEGGNQISERFELSPPSIEEYLTREPAPESPSGDQEAQSE